MIFFFFLFAVKPYFGSATYFYNLNKEVSKLSLNLLLLILDLNARPLYVNQVPSQCVDIVLLRLHNKSNTLHMAIIHAY